MRALRIAHWRSRFDQHAVGHTALTRIHGVLPEPSVFLDRLRDIPLSEVDRQKLRQNAPSALPYVLLALVQHNVSLIYDHVPRRVFNANGLDFDKWYPLPRRLPGLTRFVLTHRREREHQRRVLDTVRERFDIRCGPLMSN